MARPLQTRNMPTGCSRSVYIAASTPKANKDGRQSQTEISCSNNHNGIAVSSGGSAIDRRAAQNVGPLALPGNRSYVR